LVPYAQYFLWIYIVELNYIQNGQVGSGDSYGRRNDQNPETGAVENVLLVVAPSLWYLGDLLHTHGYRYE
jgi:hypothetical protein